MIIIIFIPSFPANISLLHHRNKYRWNWNLHRHRQVWWCHKYIDNTSKLRGTWGAHGKGVAQMYPSLRISQALYLKIARASPCPASLAKFLKWVFKWQREIADFSGWAYFACPAWCFRANCTVHSSGHPWMRTCMVQQTIPQSRGIFKQPFGHRRRVGASDFQDQFVHLCIREHAETHFVFFPRTVTNLGPQILT